MDIHKDCYSAIDLTQQDGPHRRETSLRGVGVLLVSLVIRLQPNQLFRPNCYCAPFKLQEVVQVTVLPPMHDLQTFTH